MESRDVSLGFVLQWTTGNNKERKMHLTATHSHHYNDFSGTLECEHCGATEELTTGYNDGYYHMTVIPSFHCKVCNKNRQGDIE